MKYNINSLVGDFAGRTKYNNEMIGRFADETLHTYELCEEYASLDYRPFEVTQLMNSLLGLLLLPQELLTQVTSPKKRGAKGYLEVITKLMRECQKKERYFTSFEEPEEVTSFLLHLRRAVAMEDNRGIHFYPLNGGGMDGVTNVIFYDTDGDKEFCIDLLISDIRSLVTCIAGLYEEMDKKEDIMPDYESEVARLQCLMKQSQ